MEFNWDLKNHISIDGIPSIEVMLQNIDIQLKGTGLPIEGFKFLKSSKEMLKVTREIEDEALISRSGNELFVGFQNVDKLYYEKSRYEQLISAGVIVHAFGNKIPDKAKGNSFSTWNILDNSTSKVENQWFLTSQHPYPIAFIGWETSLEIFGQGRLSDPSKVFEGFATSDLRVVASLINHLKQISKNTVDNIKTHGIDKSFKYITKRLPKKIMLITQDKGSDEHHATQSLYKKMFSELCLEAEAEAILYDISASSIFTKPGPAGSSILKNKTITWKQCSDLGRPHISNFAKSLDQLSISCKVILPEQTGFKHLFEKIKSNNVDMVIIPEYYISPSLIDKIAGNVINANQIPFDCGVYTIHTNGTFKSILPDNNSVLN